MATDTISFARGAPSLDIVDVDGLRESAAHAFERDPGGSTAYGTAIGYVPLRKWIAEQYGVGEDHVIVTNGSMQADAFLFDELVHAGGARVPLRRARARRRRRDRREADVRPHAARAARAPRRHPPDRARGRRHRR